MFIKRTIENFCCCEETTCLSASFAASKQTLLRAPVLAYEPLVFIIPLVFSFLFKAVLFSKLRSRLYPSLYFNLRHEAT